MVFAVFPLVFQPLGESNSRIPVGPPQDFGARPRRCFDFAGFVGQVQGGRVFVTPPEEGEEQDAGGFVDFLWIRMGLFFRMRVGGN